MVSLLSNTFQGLAKNKAANKMALRYGLKFGADRFVAGEKEEQAVGCVKQLNALGCSTMLNYLGEYVFTEEAANHATMQCIRTLDLIATHHLDSNLSVKISSLGLHISEDACITNLQKILTHAQQLHIFVRIEMEDYQQCEQTLRIYKQLRAQFDNVGTVLQAYLYRTMDDIQELSAYAANLRLVKGAYKESATVAMQKKEDVDANYLQIIHTHLQNGHYAGIASHDDAVIQDVIKFTEQHHIPRSQFEFQFLHGIRGDLQQQLANAGYHVRVYVPYGVDWFGYFMRRLAERPENVSFVLRNLFKK